MVTQTLRFLLLISIATLMAGCKLAVIVVEGHQLAETECPSQGTDLVRDTLHQATIPEEGIGVVIDHFVPLAVELGREDLLCKDRSACEIEKADQLRKNDTFHIQLLLFFGQQRFLQEPCRLRLSVKQRLGTHTSRIMRRLFAFCKYDTAICKEAPCILHLCLRG